MRAELLVLAVLALLITILTGTIPIASGASPISDLSYYAVYDPRTNCGVMEIRARINLEDLAYIEIPLNLFSEEAQLNLVNYTSSGDLLVLGVEENEKRVVALVYGTGELELLLYACDLLEELGVGAYSLEVSTEGLSSIALNVSVVLVFVGNYSVYVEAVKLEWSESKLDNFTLISFKGFGLARAALISSIELEEISPETSPEISLEHPQREVQWSVVGVVVGFIVVIGAVAAYFLVTRRRGGLVVERVDYLSDSGYRAIIRVLGDSGNKGLLQSEIVSKTGLSKSSVSRKLRRLEEEGLVTIKRSGKYNYVYLTEKGLKAYKKIVEEAAS